MLKELGEQLPFGELVKACQPDGVIVSREQLRDRSYVEILVGVDVLSCMSVLDEAIVEPRDVWVLTGCERVDSALYRGAGLFAVITDGGDVEIKEQSRFGVPRLVEVYFSTDATYSVLLHRYPGHRHDNRSGGISIRTLMRAPDFRAKLDDLELWNIDLKCVYWGPRTGRRGY